MKRIVSLLCFSALLLSLVSCSSKINIEKTEGEIKTEENNPQTTITVEDADEKVEITYPEGFSVGYSRVDITPTVELPIYGGKASTAMDPLQLTCTALSDGESAALLFSIDIKNISVKFSNSCMKIIENSFGIPADRIMLNVTHSHSAPAVDGTSSNATAWQRQFYKQLKTCVKNALLDLEPAEAYIGVSHTEGITFVRRYLMPGGYCTSTPTTTPLGYETQADNELRTIRFDRQNKKDILMVNYQTHYGGASHSQYSADFIHPFRESVEKDLDMLFVYHSGASGNLNFNSKIGDQKYSSYVEAIEGFMITTKDALSKEEKVQTGKIQSASSIYTGIILKDSAERIKNAQEASRYEKDQIKFNSLMAKYGFNSSREVEGIVARAKYGESQSLPFYAISFGDISFASCPYEMFDTNGVQVREGSPFKMTFVCSYTNGGFGYVPSAIAFPHKGYEVYITRFEEGSAEKFAEEMIRLLNVCKNAE